MHRGEKLNNKGFTLIETIIAMSILVLVSIPLMDSISRGMKVSRDTSSFQRAVLLGQSVTEGVRSHSVSDLCSTFVMPRTYIFDILDKNVYNYEGYSRLSTSDETSYTTMESDTAASFNSNSRKYYYGIYGVESGAKKYDVLIKLNSDEYNDINSKIIPSIVEVGSDSTVVIDNTGTLNHIGNKTLKEMAREKLGAANYLKCKMDIYITKFDAENTVTEGSYHAYGNVTYYTVSSPLDSYSDKIKEFTFLNVGEDSFDIKNKLKYMYIICNGKDLVGVNDIIFHVNVGNLLADGSENVDIPVALVTSECAADPDTKWKITSNDPDARKYLQFLTNNGSKNGMSNIYTTDGTKIDNFGDSGKKIRRIYGLTVQVYDYQNTMDKKFKTNPISNTKSAFIR